MPPTTKTTTAKTTATASAGAKQPGGKVAKLAERARKAAELAARLERELESAHIPPEERYVLTDGARPHTSADVEAVNLESPHRAEDAVLPLRVKTKDGDLALTFAAHCVTHGQWTRLPNAVQAKWFAQNSYAWCGGCLQAVSGTAGAA